MTWSLNRKSSRYCHIRNGQFPRISKFRRRVEILFSGLIHCVNSIRANARHRCDLGFLRRGEDPGRNRHACAAGRPSGGTYLYCLLRSTPGVESIAAYYAGKPSTFIPQPSCRKRHIHSTESTAPFAVEVTVSQRRLWKTLQRRLMIMLEDTCCTSCSSDAQPCHVNTAASFSDDHQKCKPSHRRWCIACHPRASQWLACVQRRSSPFYCDRYPPFAGCVTSAQSP